MKVLKVLLVCIISIVCLEGCGKIELIQNRTSVELGEEVNLDEIISYDTKKISSVTVASDGGFDSNELGNYKVKYVATTQKGKSEEFAFTISVTDTVAPTLKLDKTEFKIAKGAVFDIDTHATIKDRDENVELKANGEIDMEREGKYTVSYYAVDSSGNESDPIDVNISVVDRSGADFRNAFFGDDADTIKEFETSVFDSLNSQKDVLIFNGEYIEGVACEVTYLFDGEGKMNIGFYSNNKSTGTECLNDYDKWVALLKEEYGEPDIQSVNNLSSLAEYCSSDGQALELGYVQYWTEYDKGNMIISCYAESRDYRPYTILRYALKSAVE